MASRRASGHPPLADSVYDELLNQFMDGTRAPGEPLNIATLSRDLDVSQTPIREALARLESTGLVRRVAMKGYSVAPLFSEAELASLTEARLLLEPALTRAAAGRTSARFLLTLLDTIETLDDASASADDSRSFAGYWSADERFHSAIAAQSGNPFLAAAYSALGGQVQRFRLFARLGSSDAACAAAEHRGIYDALSAGDADLAARRMREHVTNAGARALKDRRDVDGSSDHRK